MPSSCLNTRATGSIRRAPWTLSTSGRPAVTGSTAQQTEHEQGPHTTPAEASRLHNFTHVRGLVADRRPFAPHDADLVEAALGAGVDRALRPARDGDPSVAERPASALRAGALVDLAAEAMRREPSDASVPDRYRVAVVVQPGQPTVPADRMRRRAYRLVLGAQGESSISAG